jgi:hypothetical protein
MEAAGSFEISVLLCQAMWHPFLKVAFLIDWECLDPSERRQEMMT